MIANKLNTAIDINQLAKVFVRLSLELEDNQRINKAKNELSDSAAFLVASYNSALQQTTPLNTTVKLNQTIDYAGKCKFWLEFIADEGFISKIKIDELQPQIDKVFEDLNMERLRKEKEIPAFSGEWLLDF